MENQLSIKLTIGNRQYPLKINRNEEEAIRKAARLINEKMKEYQESYAVRDTQDLLSMVALHFATEAGNSRRKNADEKDVSLQKAAEIELLLDNYLQSV